MNRAWIPWLLLFLMLTLGAVWGVARWKQQRGAKYLRPHDRIEYIVWPDCPADRSGIEFGGVCKDIATGKLFHRGTLEAIP